MVSLPRFRRRAGGPAAPCPHVRALATFLLLVAPPPLAVQDTEPAGTRPPSTVTGRVLDLDTGRGVGIATVSLAPGRDGGPGAGARVTGPDGSFRFEAVPPATYHLVVASIGYQTLEHVLVVEPEADVRVVVQLSPEPIELEPLVVTTRRRPAFMDGFEARRARDRFHTAFFTREEIEAAHPTVLSDLFVMVPGAWVRRGGGASVLTVQGDVGRSAIRSGCRPDVFVNGTLTAFPAGMPFDYVFPPEDVEAVELYTLQHEVPGRFVGPAHCGAVVIWLRQETSREVRRPTWLGWTILGAVGLGVLLTL